MIAPDQPAAKETSRRLFVYNGGFLTQRRLRRILELSGFDVRIGKPGAGDLVGIWGQSPTSGRGEAVAAHTDSPLLRVEDAFLRSVLPGRDGEPPLGLCLDHSGVHFDPARPSDLEQLLATHPLDDTALLNRARAGIDRLRRGHLSKYSGFDPALAAPEPGYVLVIDQTAGDASVRASRADRNSFREMLYFAQTEHPGARIVIKAHPETVAGHRKGHFSADDQSERITLCTDPLSPWALFDGAVAVYTVSSQLGFEAILTGHRPVVFGQPFYAGWGLSDDRQPLDRRQRRLTRNQLFAAAMILYPRWYDPFHDRLCTFETALDAFEAATRAWREDHRGWVAGGMRLWKRGPLQRVFGQQRRMIFADPPDRAIARAERTGRRLMVWAGRSTPELDLAGVVRIEDGLIRSRGLGAELIPPLSLVCDDLGIYYDPTRPSRLEALIEASATLPDEARLRAERLIRRLIAARLNKYNIGGREALPPGLPEGRRILVAGQVEDDASIRLGAGEIRTNLGLLEAVRRANPAATILYKPHPDVEAGLRPGRVMDAASFAHAVLDRTDAISAIEAVDEVWTMTSALGFEALMRGRKVVCLGQPFYAGWGLTDDRVPQPARRTASPDLVALVHAVLIDYPRYHDPVTGLPCPVEVVVDRLAADQIPLPGPFNRAISKLQGVLASYAHLWR